MNYPTIAQALFYWAGPFAMTLQGLTIHWMEGSVDDCDSPTTTGDRNWPENDRMGAL